jgi:type VI secretion system secreted protein VgrG
MQQPAPSAISLFSQQNRLLQLRSPLGDSLLLDRFQGTEGLSVPFRFTLDLISERADLTLRELMGQELAVELANEDGARRFSGRVVRFAHTGSDGGFAFYRAELGPWTEFLERRVNCRIFHGLTLPELLCRLFGEYGARARYQLDLDTGHYPPMTQCTQYRETDFAFVCRLLEAEGIHYRFRFDPDGHTLVLADSSRHAPPMPVRERIEYLGAHGAGSRDGIDRWGCERALVATGYAIKSFDFQQPGDRLVAEQSTTHDMGAVPRLERYDHEGSFAYVDFDDGNRIARLRVEEADLRAKTFFGEGNCRFLASGHCFELADHYDSGAGVHDRRFLVTAVTHEAANNYRESGGRPHYRNHFTCVRARIPFRPPLRTPRPVLRGPQTATVVGPPGEEIHCDRYGRVKVQFHWDREGEFTDASSCWVRVATPLAGSRFGVVALPRVGHEVVVAFLEGNPDRPIIIGQAYNARNLPPWELPASRTQSGILTRSTLDGDCGTANALRFEDRKGEEEVWLHAEKDQRIEVEHDERHDVGHDRAKDVGHDETTRVEHDRSERVGNDETIAVGRDRTETVGRDETLTVDGHQRLSVGASQTVTVGSTKLETVTLASTELVGAARSLSVGGAYAVIVGAAKNEAVGLGSFEQVGAEKSTLVGLTYHIEAKEQLEIVVGQSRLILAKDGTITLAGVRLELIGSKQVTVQGQIVDLNL